MRYIKLPDPNIIPTAIISDVRFYGFFNDYIDALNDTHIVAKVGEASAAAFRNRKRLFIAEYSCLLRV